MYKTIHTMVFQEHTGGGNPCPVTLNADDLTIEQMQEMARQSGEECIFLTRPTRSDCDFRARYFVPAHEMGMCIHATIGATTVLVLEGQMEHSPIMFETSLGSVQVDWSRQEDSIDVGVAQFLPEFGEKAPSPEQVCHALRICPELLGEGPIQSVSTSRFKLMVPLVSRDVLDNLTPDFEYLWQLCDECGASGFYPFVLENRERDCICFARQFPNRSGYQEVKCSLSSRQNREKRSGKYPKGVSCFYLSLDCKNSTGVMQPSFF